jgi:DNA-binding SARP family transcriptional activator
MWPDSTEEQARTNLRGALLHLRQALPNADRFLQSEGQMLQWRSDAPFLLDVAEFERAMAQGERMQAVDVYRGDLLPDCYDDWIIPERVRLRLMLGVRLVV